MEFTILIIDDKIKLCKSIARNFDQLGFKTFFATNSKESIELFLKHEMHVVLLDIMLGQENGLDLLRRLLLLKEVPIIMITGYGTIESAIKAIKLGAFEYIQKPLDFESLMTVILNAIRKFQARSAVSAQLTDKENCHERIITCNNKMLEICEKAKLIAATNLPVLIYGETGTGKELIADLIHFHSTRGKERPIKINCASFPESLLDNELFGHEKGAFTDAGSVYKGVFERANTSTLFLDELGDMPFSTQTKILRAIENQEIMRIGGDTAIKIDVRFIASTNRDLNRLIENNTFRRDLFYRLNAATIELPPLRERKEDIPLLIDHFLREDASVNKHIKIDSEIMSVFFNYEWPGNIRELCNAVRYATAVAKNGVIKASNLPSYFMKEKKEDLATNIREESEKNLILRTLSQARSNKSKTARILNMSRKTLYNKLVKYGIHQHEQQ